MLLKVCVNGSRDPSEHAKLRSGPEGLARDAAAAIAAGAGAAHLHPKNDAGQDSLRAGDVASWLAYFRAACPGSPLGVTTGAWAVPDAATRARLVNEWTALPDFASVNWHEDGAEEVAGILLGRGIGVEAGLWHAEAAAQWAASPLRDQCLRVLIEIGDIPAVEVEPEAERLLTLVRKCSGNIPVLLHGEGSSAWEAVRLAAAWGLDSRIGLEDTLVTPNGTAASDNEELVRAATELMARNTRTLR